MVKYTQFGLICHPITMQAAASPNAAAALLTILSLKRSKEELELRFSSDAGIQWKSPIMEVGASRRAPEWSS